MAKILIKLPRKVKDEETGKTVRLGDFERYYVEDPSKPFSDHQRTTPADILLQPPHRFLADKEEYMTLDADWLDSYKRLRRLAQIITLKDIGRVITLLGINHDSVVVEAGSGSGAAGCYLANLCRHVHSYDVRKEHLEVAQENALKLGINNITFTLADIYDEQNMGAHEADAFLLDVPDPSKALASVVKALRMGGRCVVYTPNITQIQGLKAVLPDTLFDEGTIELTERHWEVKERIARPQIQGLGHTAFLTLLRKVPEKLTQE